jgi:hypothetical protein
LARCRRELAYQEKALTEVLIANHPDFGGELSTEFFRLLSDSSTSKLRLVTGYFGKETVRKIHEMLDRIPNVSVEIIVGMAAKEGLAETSYDSLIRLHRDLRFARQNADDRRGVYVFFSGPSGERDRGMHAKAYLFDVGNDKHLILGSSNMSYSGFNMKGNIELNLSQTNSPACDEFESFFEFLHQGNLAVEIDSIEDFPIRGKAKSIRVEKFVSLSRGSKPKDFKKFPYVDIDLVRNIDNQLKSNLNCCFGKGRWARATGLVKPRDWYEVELICPTNITSDENYPKGDFNALTSDGYRFEGRTSGDYYKNFRSKDDLKILGYWIKGALEDAGSLSDDPQLPVTEETFREYGNSVLRLYRTSESEVVLHFPRDPMDL